MGEHVASPHVNIYIYMYMYVARLKSLVEMGSELAFAMLVPSCLRYTHIVARVRSS